MRIYPLDADQTAHAVEFLPDGRLIAAYLRHHQDRHVGEGQRPRPHLDVFDVQEAARIDLVPYSPLFSIQEMLARDTDRNEPRSFTLEFVDGENNHWRWHVTPAGLDPLVASARAVVNCRRTPFGYWVSLLCEDCNSRYLRGVADRNNTSDVRMEEVPFAEAPNTLVFGSDPNTFVAGRVAAGFSDKMSTIHHNGNQHPIRRPDGSLLRRWPFAIATGPAQTIVLAKQKPENIANEVLFVDNATGNVAKVMSIGPVAAVALSSDNLTAAFAQQGRITTVDLDW